MEHNDRCCALRVNEYTEMTAMRNHVHRRAFDTMFMQGVFKVVPQGEQNGRIDTGGNIAFRDRSRCWLRGKGAYGYIAM